jgi:hypothetical protein
MPNTYRPSCYQHSKQPDKLWPIPSSTLPNSTLDFWSLLGGLTRDSHDLVDKLTEINGFGANKPQETMAELGGGIWVHAQM